MWFGLYYILELLLKLEGCLFVGDFVSFEKGVFFGSIWVELVLVDVEIEEGGVSGDGGGGICCVML